MQTKLFRTLGFFQLKQPAIRDLLRKWRAAMADSTYSYALSSKCFGLFHLMILVMSLKST
jgi:hypothetical protein